MKSITKKHSGFSLIELMVVVVIIGILASVAIPSYTAYVENGRRAEGKAFALDIASRQERHYTNFSRYAGSLTGSDNASLGMASLSSENSAYSGVITLANGNTTYTIELTPAITDATCGVLTLTNTGARNSGTGVAECWR
jgi:type IV pilus assembly protein PilE